MTTIPVQGFTREEVLTHLVAAGEDPNAHVVDGLHARLQFAVDGHDVDITTAIKAARIEVAREAIQTYQHCEFKQRYGYSATAIQRYQHSDTVNPEGISADELGMKIGMEMHAARQEMFGALATLSDEDAIEVLQQTLDNDYDGRTFQSAAIEDVRIWRSRTLRSGDHTDASPTPPVAGPSEAVVESNRRLAALVSSGVYAELRPSQQDLLRSGHILIAGPTSDYLPEEVQREFVRRRNSGFGAHGLAVCVLRDDKQIVVALDDDAQDVHSLQHELIHVAQVHAPAGAMKATFKAAAEAGQGLVALVTELCGALPEGGAYSDLSWTRSACSVALETSDERRGRQSGSKRHTPNDVYFGAFELALTVHPRSETLELALTVGLTTRHEVVAALHAHFMLEQGYVDWGSDVGREIVAHRFERAWHPTLDALTNEATRLSHEHRIDIGAVAPSTDALPSHGM
jgi:hypothetical protein